AAMEAFEWGEIQVAAEKGLLEVVRYLHEGVGVVVPTHETLAMAGGSGNLELLKYLHGIGAECANSTLSHAFSSGNVETVRFVLENCSWDATESPGCLVGLEEKITYEKPAFLQCALVRAAEEGDHAKIQKLCLEDFCRVPLVALRQAAAKGRWDTGRLLVALPGAGFQVKETAALEAAKYGDLETFKFVFERFPRSVPEEAFLRAADEGHLEIVKFYHENHPRSCEIDRGGGWSCADRGLKPLPDRMVERNDAAVLQVYRYLVGRCECERKESFGRFVERRQLDLVELLAPRLDPFYGMDRCAAAGYLDGFKVMMKYWRRVKVEVDVDIIPRASNVEVVRYLMGTGRFDIIGSFLPYLAQKGKCIETLKFVVESKPDADLLDALGMAFGTWNVEAFRFLRNRIPASQMAKWKPGELDLFVAILRNSVRALEGILSMNQELGLGDMDVVRLFYGFLRRMSRSPGGCLI
ncbi:hypothetical protein HDU97_008840, partial [Phlyctochytrium planicorne]